MEPIPLGMEDSGLKDCSASGCRETGRAEPGCQESGDRAFSTLVCYLEARTG